MCDGGEINICMGLWFVRKPEMESLFSMAIFTFRFQNFIYRSGIKSACVVKEHSLLTVVVARNDPQAGLCIVEVEFIMIYLEVLYASAVQG